MTNDDNVGRLVSAGILDSKGLSKTESNLINSIDLSDDEINALASIQKKLELKPLMAGDTYRLLLRAHL